MSISLFGVSSQDYIRLLESGNLAFFSQFTCFRCGSSLWRNGYRQRHLPCSMELLRLKCSNLCCKAHYTLYPTDVLPRHRYHLETVLTLTRACLNAASSQEKTLTSYQHGRERRIDDCKVAGPDVSTLRRWLKKLSDPTSFLCLFLSARKMVAQPPIGLIMVVYLTISLAFQLIEPFLTMHGQSSPIAPVTADPNQVNSGVVSSNDPNFYTQEHPP